MTRPLTRPTVNDAHAHVTVAIIRMLETADARGGELPWHRPGAAVAQPENVLTKRRYRGINVLSLWAAGEVANYQSGLWASARQWQRLGATVVQDQAPTLVVFYRPLGQHSAILRFSLVFNAAQVSGYRHPAPPPSNKVAALTNADRFVRKTGINVVHGGGRAFYRPSTDKVHMPDRALFRDTQQSSATHGFYGVLFHELAHASGARKRLNRDLSGRFGSEAYAMEELTAELTSALLCSDLGVTAQPRPDHAHYLKNWLAVLRNDDHAILVAAAHASRSAAFLQSGATR